ncbi:Bug family tripartite tricarboxylate transporter substrate binding protein [Granulosicoccus sp. 3-233]|uniref:Bug family tripartite tricarboxylate transporter substrate binding protein n=1 Tax=Granulosicoccus sp. 3-233 TaxID=3417969 RepID=UPI003D34655D
MKKLALAAFTTVATLSLVCGPALAEYPERDIRVVVPWGAGGGTDGIVRKLTTIAEGQLNTSMYVENIEGGISATGISEVMSARPDGYTIGMLTYDSVITVPWQALLPNYKLDRLELIARVTSEPDALIAAASSPYESLSDVLEAAKAAPGKVRIGMQNIGSRLHLAALQLQQETGTEFKLIAYPGGAAQQKEAMLNGEVELVTTSLGDFSSLLNEDSARGIVEFSDTPNPTYSDVPTAADEDLSLRMGSFIVVAAPAGVSEEVVGKIEAAYRFALDSDEFQSWVADVGVTPNWLGSDEVGAWASDTQAGIFKQLDELVASGVISK